MRRFMSVLLAAIMCAVAVCAHAVAVESMANSTASEGAAANTAAVASAPIETQRPNLDVKKIAHRGASIYAPENTIPAIEKAIALGMDYVEIDVRYTKDDVAVLMHDASVERTTNGTGKVADMTLEEIKKLDAARGYVRNMEKFAGTRVPTLREALESMKGRINVYYDQKETMRDETIAMLREFGFFPDNMVITGGVEKNGELRARAKDAPIMPNLDSLEAMPELLRQLPAPRAFNTNCAFLTPELVDAAHAEGVMVFTNTLGLCDMPQEMRKMIKMGPDAIQTDRPVELIETIEKMNKKAAKAAAEKATESNK